jgi:hypothetical protein
VDEAAGGADSSPEETEPSTSIQEVRPAQSDRQPDKRMPQPSDPSEPTPPRIPGE